MNKLNQKIYKKGIASICVVILLILSIVSATGVFSSGALAYSSDKEVEFKISPKKDTYGIDEEFSVEAEYKNDSGQACEFEADVEYPKEDLKLVEENELKSFSLKPNDTITLTYKFKVKKEISNPYEDIKLTVNEKEKKTIPLYKNRLRNHKLSTARGNSSTTSFKVIKRWSDGAGNHKDDSISVTLLQNGKPYKKATINQNSNWSYTFNSLPAFDNDGQKLEYKIQEQEFEGYDTDYGQVKAKGGSTTGETYYELIDYDEIQSSDDIVMVISKYGRSYIVSASGESFDCGESAEFKDSDQFVLTNTSLSSDSIWEIEKFSGVFTAYNKGSSSYLNKDLEGEHKQRRSTYMEYDNDYYSDEYRTVRFTDGEGEYLGIHRGRLVKERHASSKVRFYKKITETNTIPKMYVQTITNDKVSIKKQIDALKDNEGSNKNPDTNVKGKDDYRLYLDVSGGVREKPIDVLLVVDNTSSMEDSYYYKGEESTREIVANELVNGTGSTNSGQSKSDGIISEIMRLNPKNKVGVITFCGAGKHSEGLIFPDDKDRFTEAVLNWNSLSDTGGSVPYVDVSHKTGSGTNYMSALLRADEYFSNSKVFDDGNDKYMIFISDGRANDRMDSLGDGRYEYVMHSGQDVNFYKNFFVSSNPDVKSFFIGIKHTGDSYPELEQMGGGLYSNGGNYYPASDGDELAKAFSHIKESLYPDDVKITDVFSQYVNLNLDEPDLKVERTYKDSYGQEHKEVVWKHKTSINANGGNLGNKPYGATDCVQYVKYTPSKNNDSTGKIELKFKKGYKIGKDNKFIISYNVKANKKAKTKLRESQGRYPNKGDSNTDFANNDTSSNKKGFFANKEAYVEYKTANVELKKKMYRKPVVQTSLDIGFTKLDRLDENITLDGAVFKCFKANGNISTPVSSWTKGTQIGDEIISKNGGKFELEDIKEGCYILEETKAPAGYELKQETKTWYISYSMSHGITVFDSNGKKFDVKNKFPDNSIRDYNYCIVNSKLYELPKAGGMGTYAFYLTGSFILVISIIGLRRKIAA